MPADKNIIVTKLYSFKDYDVIQLRDVVGHVTIRVSVVICNML